MPNELLTVDEKPVYLSFTTLINFLDKSGAGPLPPRLDKSALENYSGATQALLMGALRQIGFVDQEGNVKPALGEAAHDLDARKSHLEAWARFFYSEQILLAEQNATSQMLLESFAKYGYTGSTLRKAVVFYLNLVEYIGLPNSSFFKPPKQAATPTSRRRPKAAVTPERPKATPVSAPQGSGTEVVTVKIGELATVTVGVDAQWMKLPIETITSLRQAIDQLVALGSPQRERA